MADEIVEEKPKSSNLKLIVTAVLALVLGGAGTYLGVAFLGGSEGEPKEEAPEAEPEAYALPEDEADYGVRRPPVKSTLSLEPFLVNLADQDSSRFVKATFALGLGDEGLGETLATDTITLAHARDSIVSILSSKFSEEILTPEGKDALRKEIMRQINAVLPDVKVRDVFIMDLVVQL